MNTPSRKQHLSKVRNLVIKVGTSVVTRADGELDYIILETLAREISELIARGMRVTLVTSGAVGAGLRVLGLDQRPSDIPTLQATAACGQIRLMSAYEAAFGHYRQRIAQVLLTAADLDERVRYLNTRNTLRHLVSFGVLPIINENDTVATDELRFGDNDQLSAQVVDLVEADLLLILSDIDGLYDENPHTNPAARRFPLVESIDQAILGLAGPSTSATSRGGMASKLGAAKAVTDSGAMVLIGHGKRPYLQQLLESDEAGTLFLTSVRERRPPGRFRWLKASTKPKGVLHLDAGAVKALRQRGSSLLPAGIQRVEGEFLRGDTVEIRAAADGVLIGKGLSNYSSRDVDRIRGRRSEEIRAILGYDYGDTVIHRDNCYITEDPR